MKADYGFSFVHSGSCFDQSRLQFAADGQTKTGTMDAGFGLQVTSRITEYPELSTRYWETEYANTGSENTGCISRINDASVLIRFKKPYEPPKPGYRRDTFVSVTSFRGSKEGIEEYAVNEREIKIGEKFTYATSGGRSCNLTAPYFCVNLGDSGVVIGLGWTGQWNASFEYTREGILFKYGIEDAAFYLKPGERVTTGSVLLTEYENGRMNGHNLFRRVMKQRSVMGKGKRPPYGRIGAMTWGSTPSSVMIEHVDALKKLDTGVECFFIDSNWFGHESFSAVNEHDSTWYFENGSWNVNPVSHPNGLEDVAKKVHEAGMELLLWFEPERASADSDWAKQHPEYMLSAPPPGNGFQYHEKDRLVNIGIEGAWQMMFDMLCDYIERLDIQCYRQDFNFDPLPFWRAADEPDRYGITEIKYINALYRLWDALLERFPGLYIDNCAAGGRRNDIEMLRRAIPLWRSDLQCAYNADPEFTQAQSTGVTWLMPYSGTGINGPMEDTYEIRSCYGASLSVHTWWWSRECHVEESAGLDNARRLFKEYKLLRPLLCCDFYPLTNYSLSRRDWCVWQFDDPENGAGCVIAFRRSQSNVSRMTFQLNGLSSGDYTFTNLDTHQKQSLRGEDLLRSGLDIHLPEQRSSTIFLYQKNT